MLYQKNVPHQTPLPVRAMVFPALLTIGVSLSGCAETPPGATAGARTSEVAGTEPTSGGTSAKVTAGKADASKANSEMTAAGQSTVDSPEVVEFKPLSAAVLSSGAGARSGTASRSSSGEVSLRAVMERLKPLQVLLGQWRGTTRREYEGFKAVDQHEWIWDLRTKPDQPALILTSDKSPYLRKARLSWNNATSQFELSATDADDITREYTGDFTEPVHEVVGSDDKLHRVFRLEFTQTDGSAESVGGERWQIAFAQQENNRYLLEVSRRRGTAAFSRFDTVSTQREGTSFAVSDSSYGEKECVISQGLGTMTVSYKGKTYWVCCSGCKAAFEEDPETWIARYEARKAK
ncbi:MAG: hypothetical protein KDA89_05085 [Planctomycetaceae bacterium]|nr:hypothetical protein [Planctomycetaceae bacterium]